MQGDRHDQRGESAEFSPGPSQPAPEGGSRPTQRRLRRIRREMPHYDPGRWRAERARHSARTRGQVRGVHDKVLVVSAVEVRQREPDTWLDKRKSGRSVAFLKLQHRQEPPLSSCLSPTSLLPAVDADHETLRGRGENQTDHLPGRGQERAAAAAWADLALEDDHRNGEGSAGELQDPAPLIEEVERRAAPIGNLSGVVVVEGAPSGARSAGAAG